MREVRSLNVCGLTYRVFLAIADEVPELEEEEGFTSYRAGHIYLREYLSKEPRRLLNVLVHELAHAFVEGSGLDGFFRSNVRGEYDGANGFEETFIRLLTPWIVCLVEQNGGFFVFPGKGKSR